MISKENLLRTLELMPEKIDIDELLDGILLIQKIESGLNDSEERNIISHAQFKNEIGQWLTSIGQKQQGNQ